jgi:hydroxypyruvate isomerase
VAAVAGFDAVECHVPFDTDPVEIRTALAATGLSMVSLNTRSGDPAAGERGLAAVVGRTADARALIDEAVAYATSIGCGNVHVLAGVASGPEAYSTYVENLAYAGEQAEEVGVGILIEPINQRDMPGYFLSSIDDASAIAAAAGPNVRVMFDCYHVQIEHGDLLRCFEQHLPSIGHVQFASVPDRCEPDRGEVDYGWILPRFYEAGYAGFVGAEYRPSDSNGSVEAGLDWLQHFR